MRAGSPSIAPAAIADTRSRSEPSTPKVAPRSTPSASRTCLADRRPGEFFVVDANGGLTPETALRMLRLLPDGLDFVLEAPCATWRETISLRRRCRYPIIIDELAQLGQRPRPGHRPGRRRWVRAEDLQGRAGSLRVAASATSARAAGLTISVQDTVGSSFAFATILHLGATVPPRLLRGVLNTEDMVTLKTAEFDCIRRDDGICPPDTPGWGSTCTRTCWASR